MKKIIKKLLMLLGYNVNKIKPSKSDNGLDKRPIGSMRCLLEDLKQRGLNCNTILDIGANRTNWSRMAKNIYPNANFCLIEPQIEMQIDLDKFCEEFDGSIHFFSRC
jgi:hypothetical protein